jgi:UDP-N-acetylglucosamine transferase subunit ALG13
VILVTAGTTMPFDELFVEVDRLAAAGLLADLQSVSGQTTYQMKHGEQFVAKPSLNDLIDASSLVITHGGATVIQALLAKKPFVAFANPRGAGDHQRAFLERVATIADISWSTDVKDLERLVRERMAAGPSIVNKAIPRAADIVMASIAR